MRERYSYLSKTQSREEYIFFTSCPRHQTIFMHPMDYLLSLRFLEIRPSYKKVVKSTTEPRVELRGHHQVLKNSLANKKGQIWGWRPRRGLACIIWRCTACCSTYRASVLGKMKEKVCKSGNFAVSSYYEHLFCFRSKLFVLYSWFFLIVLDCIEISKPKQTIKRTLKNKHSQCNFNLSGWIFECVKLFSKSGWHNWHM